jgi:hypothetical protein
MSAMRRLVLADGEGAAAVRLARRALEDALGPHPSRDLVRAVTEDPTIPVFGEKRGVFVTLKRFPDGALRGCIGYPLPLLPLRAALAGAAVSAAVDDFRFRPVHATDLSRLTIEVSVLTVPVPIRFTTPEEAVRAITVGRDGLIVEGLGSSGLLLPQVAPEEGWTSEQFLNGTCEKAGLPPRSWQDPRVSVRRFEAEIFHELSPGGDIVRVDPAATARSTTGGGPSARRT